MTKTQDNMIELEYTTWGSHGQFKRSIAVLIDGQVLDPKDVPRGKNFTTKKKIVINGKEYEIEYIARDSNKNAHRYIKLPKEIVLAIIHEGATSSGWKGYQIEGPGEIITEDQLREQVNGRFKYTKTVRAYYYRYNNINVKLSEETLGFEKELVAKPQVELLINDLGNISRIRARGDTFHVKDVLKSIGYRWDGVTKTWYYDAKKEELDDVLARTKLELSPFAEVIMK